MNMPLNFCKKLLFLWFFISCLPLFSQEKKEVLSQDNQMLCGIHSLYTAEALLLGSKPDFLTLVKQFPDVVKSGVSLAQLQEYLEKKKFHCQFKKMKLKEFSSLNPRVVGFVLKERKPISHIYLVTPVGDGKIQIYDHPNPPRNLQPLDETPSLVMIVSQFPEDLPFEWKNIFRMASIGCLFVGGYFLVKGVRRWRKTNIKKKKIPHIKTT